MPVLPKRSIAACIQQMAAKKKKKERRQTQKDEQRNIQKQRKAANKRSELIMATYIFSLWSGIFNIYWTEQCEPHAATHCFPPRSLLLNLATSRVQLVYTVISGTMQRKNETDNQIKQWESTYFRCLHKQPVIVRFLVHSYLFKNAGGFFFGIRFLLHHQVE